MRVTRCGRFRLFRAMDGAFLRRRRHASAELIYQCFAGSFGLTVAASWASIKPS